MCESFIYHVGLVEPGPIGIRLTNQKAQTADIIKHKADQWRPLMMSILGSALR